MKRPKKNYCELVEELTLTVVDGDFPREVLANENLRFADFEMAANRNNPRQYDTPTHGPTEKKKGILISGYLPTPTPHQMQERISSTRFESTVPRLTASLGFGFVALLMMAFCVKIIAPNK